MLKGNAIVGQSGGPTSAINATLSGVIRGCAKSEYIEKLFGMVNGIEGFLENNIIDLSYLFENEESLISLDDIVRIVPISVSVVSRSESVPKTLPHINIDKRSRLPFIARFLSNVGLG